MKEEDNRILVRRLEQVIRDDRVSHAYILEDHCIDKKAFAESFVKENPVSETSGRKTAGNAASAFLRWITATTRICFTWRRREAPSRMPTSWRAGQAENHALWIAKCGDRGGCGHHDTAGAESSVEDAGGTARQIGDCTAVGEHRKIWCRPFSRGASSTGLTISEPADMIPCWRMQRRWCSC